MTEPDRKADDDVTPVLAYNACGGRGAVPCPGCAGCMEAAKPAAAATRARELYDHIKKHYDAFTTSEQIATMEVVLCGLAGIFVAAPACATCAGSGEVEAEDPWRTPLFCPKCNAIDGGKAIPDV